MVLIGLVCSSFVTVSAGTHQRAPFAPLGATTHAFVQMGNILASRSLTKCWEYFFLKYPIGAFKPPAIRFWLKYQPLSFKSPRVCALIMVISAMNGAWLIEQPRSSQLIWHPRVRQLFRALPKVPCWEETSRNVLVQFVCSAKTYVRILGTDNLFQTLVAPKVYQAAWWMGSYGAPTPKRHIAYSNAPSVQLLDLGSLVKEVRKRLSKHNQQSSRTYVSRDGKQRFVGTRFLKRTQTLRFKECFHVLMFFP